MDSNRRSARFLRLNASGLSSTLFLCVATLGLASTDPVVNHALPPCLERTASRIRAYCNAPVPAANAEGLPPVEGAKLLQAHLLFRHGDRSAIHSLPGAEKPLWECDAPSPHEAAWAASALAPFVSSPECISGPDHLCGEANRSMTQRVQHALRAWRATRFEDEPCGPDGGELSSIGWQQLQDIGSAVAGRYNDLLRRDDPRTTALRVISTDTGRTTLSATAMLRGLLHGLHVHPPSQALANGSLLGPSGVLQQPARAAAAAAADAVAISAAGVASADGAPLAIAADSAPFAIEETSQAGVIPQLRLPLRLHILPREVDPMMVMTPSRLAQCPAAKEWEKANLEDVFAFARTPAPIAKRIARMAGVAVDDVPPTEAVADDLFTRLCHGLPLPCWKQPPSPPTSKVAGGGAARKPSLEDPPSGAASTAHASAPPSDAAPKFSSDAAEGEVQPQGTLQARRQAAAAAASLTARRRSGAAASETQDVAGEALTPPATDADALAVPALRHQEHVLPATETPSQAEIDAAAAVGATCRCGVRLTETFTQGSSGVAAGGGGFDALDACSSAAGSLEEHLRTRLAWAPPCLALAAELLPPLVTEGPGVAGWVPAGDNRVPGRSASEPSANFKLWRGKEANDASSHLQQQDEAGSQALTVQRGGADAAGHTVGDMASDIRRNALLQSAARGAPSKVRQLHGLEAAIPCGAGAASPPATEAAAAVPTDSSSGSAAVAAPQPELQCMDVCDAVTMLERGDLLYANRMRQPSVRRLIYPFVQQLLGQMTAAAHAAAASLDASASLHSDDAAAGPAQPQSSTTAASFPPRMFLRAAHDTVISPLLSSLGWTHRPYPWPGYASRVAIELWQVPPSLSTLRASGKAELNDAVASKIAEGAGSSRNRDAIGFEDERSLLLRIVYNGEEVTHLTDCAAFSQQPEARGEASSSAQQVPLCTLAGLRRLAASFIAPAATWEEACATPTAA